MRRIMLPVFFALSLLVFWKTSLLAQIGVEKAIPVHLEDGQEFQTSTHDLIAFGQKLFTAMWTTQEGGGRPLSKGNGNPLPRPRSPSKRKSRAKPLSG